MISRTTRRGWDGDLWADYDIDRFHVFVPAVMSVGLAVSLFSLIRDALGWLNRRSRRSHSERRGRVVADVVVGELAKKAPSTATDNRATDGEASASDMASLALYPRNAYRLSATLLIAAAAYLSIGAIGNYQRENGYVSDIAWLLAISLGVAATLSALGSLAAFVSVRGRTSPAWVQLALDRLPLGGRIGVSDAASLPSWQTSFALQFLALITLVITLMVGSSRAVVQGLDDVVLERIAQPASLAGLRVLDLMGSSAFAIVLAGVIGLAALRCRPLAAAYIMSVFVGLAASGILRAVIERPRPPGGPMSGGVESFPSGHTVQTVLIAGLVPLALATITRRRQIVRPARYLLGALALAAAIQRIHERSHWPSDVAGGALIGLTLVVAVHWVIEHASWHAACRGCPWFRPQSSLARRGVISLTTHALRIIRGTAHTWGIAASVGLAALTLTVGVPQDPEGFGYGSSIAEPLQLGLAGLVVLGGLLAWLRPALGAFLIALAALALGVFAAAEYRPTLAIGLIIALLVPAVLFWLVWQHEQTWGSIVLLASVTVLLLGTGWAGIMRVNAFYYGPQTQVSSTVGLAQDRVRWVWSGGVEPTAAVIVARLHPAPDAATVRGELVPESLGASSVAGAKRSTRVENVDEHGLVRLRVESLEPNTTYRYQIYVDGKPDKSRGVGRLRTPGQGAFSFKLAFGSCARTGSNASVYDAIRAENPLLFVGLGDLHYGNIESVDESAFLAAYDRMFDSPAQAALYRSIPLAYVWDDHDYGPNDADSTSPGRSAARSAYRDAVPYRELAFGAGDAAISQAFTIGRVRLVLTDTRSERDNEFMLGRRQEAWLIDELIRASRTHSVVVWANPDPWVGPAKSGGDSWAGYPDDRERIAAALLDAGVDNLVMISGDAHMAALDDGTNTQYAPGGGKAFPLMHAAALDRPGNVKGGPYSGGAFPGAGQFGVIEIKDTGQGPVDVVLRAMRWDGREIVKGQFTFAP